MTRTDTEWTIAELSREVEAALAVGYEPPSNGQVRAVPDKRAIRYYTSLGLLDKPAAMKGRTALYNRRHLQQLVAIKRLQAKGLSLSEIQTELTGVADGRLAELAQLPRVPATRSRKARKAARDGFWRAMPADEAAPAPAPAAQPPAATVRRLIQLEIAPGVNVSIDTNRNVDAEDAAALAAAAAPLLDELKNRGLLPVS